MSAEVQESGKKGKGSKQKKMTVRVDFTPMVDMNMLLITFFMLCTTLSKPQTMEISMPSNDKNITEEQQSKVKASQAITLLLAGGDKLYYYEGEPNYKDYTSLKETSYNADGTLINTSVENNFGIMRLMVKLENFKKFLPGDTRRDVTLKDVYNKVENGELELVGLYPHKYWGVMNGSTRVRCDDYPIYRYSDLLLMLAEAKVLLGEDPATEINRVRRRAFGDAYDASTVGFPNQEVDKRPADAVLQERLFEFMLEGKRWYDLRRFGDSYVLDYTPAESARLLWPINQGALTNNPLLKQTVGY